MAELGDIAVSPYPKPGAVMYPDDGGLLTISGTLTVDGAPAKRKVLLMHRKSKRFLAETWSDPVTGVYTFTGLAGSPREFIVLGLDETGLNAEVADHLTAS